MNDSGFPDLRLPAARQPKWENPRQLAPVRNVPSVTDSLIAPRVLPAHRGRIVSVRAPSPTRAKGF